MFQDMESLRAEASSDTDDTQEYSYTCGEADLTLADDAINEVSSPSPVKKKKRSREITYIAFKKAKHDLPGESPATIASDTDNKSKDTVVVEKQEKTESVAESKQTGTVATAPEDDLKLKPAAASTSADSSEDAIAETLLCIICQGLLHDCISLQPCMHSFCSGCYSEWMEKSDECPSCRMKVERINKNHIVNNLVEAYLKVKPEKRRPEDEIEMLNDKNKITRDMLYPTKLLRERISDDDDYSEGDSDEDEDDRTPGGDNFGAGAGLFLGAGGGIFNPPVPAFNPGGLVFGLGTPFFGTAINRAARPICRQCPDYVDPLAGQDLGIMGAPPPTANPGPGAATTDAQPSTSGQTAAADPDVKTMPAAPDYTCPPGGNHVLCLCCMLPMPDRRADGLLPPQQCSVCYRAFCHAYWGCRKVDCNGCIGKFKDMNFGKKCLTSLILDNQFESEIFKNYLEGRGLSVKAVLADCLSKMVAGEFVCTNQADLMSKRGINTPVCYACGLRNFKDLAYYYRKNIPNDELPAEVRSRPNCYWGKNCRTQRNKPEHARRFNHICDQTRTM
ncbi:E3 ubiquitin-protein ligase CHFR-like isoform X2 [Physella acuta]|nr:E3 ubiquitin-protein ligase CHFR-like isoform X2 [Physella acuta]